MGVRLDLKLHYLAGSLFSFLSSLGQVVWSEFVSLSSREFFYVAFSWIDSGLCIYHFVVWSNFTLLHNSSGSPFPPQSCLVLYYFCGNWLHLFFMWLIASSLSPYLIIIIIIYSVFHTSVSRWFLTGNWISACLLNSFRTLLCILVEFDNSVVWIVSSRSLISKSSSPFTNSSVTILSAPITIGITVTFLFRCCFRSYLIILFLSIYLLIDYFCQIHLNCYVKGSLNWFIWLPTKFHSIWCHFMVKKG